ncbi:ribosome assembly cofactor RimP [Mesomycoplasma conjunctivae]|uniref:ribosome assembly cofactor RimP n=1 Tax=Mesomycoplasma conjunctivae TaxID=45361 RepID=UPI003DA2662A
MDIEQKIVENFPEVAKAEFILEDGHTFLRIYTTLTTMKDIEDISKKISDFIDKIELKYNNFYLDILSKGVDE